MRLGVRGCKEGRRGGKAGGRGEVRRGYRRERLEETCVWMRRSYSCHTRCSRKGMPTCDTVRLCVRVRSLMGRDCGIVSLPHHDEKSESRTEPSS